VDSLFDAPLRSEVVPLETLRRNDLERGGGKGANLGELISVGLPVPPGFCVTTVAYRRAVAETGLAEVIDEALRDVRDEDLASAEAASASIGTLFEDLPLPDDLAEAILAAYRSLGAPPVAVRSSATTEDLPGASFAGQQATSLNVRGGTNCSARCGAAGLPFGRRAPSLTGSVRAFTTSEPPSPSSSSGSSPPRSREFYSPPTP
jgi:phosphoenolpyruvate synthase/pyruvate phosphate dikinase